MFSSLSQHNHTITVRGRCTPAHNTSQLTDSHPHSGRQESCQFGVEHRGRMGQEEQAARERRYEDDVDWRGIGHVRHCWLLAGNECSELQETEGRLICIFNNP